MTTLKKSCGRGSNLALVIGLTSVFASASTQARAADQASTDRQLAAICGQTACRTEKIIELRAPKDNVVRFKSDPVPYVYNGTLTIYPGETYAVRMRVRGTELGAPVFENGSEGKPLPAPTGYKPEVEAKAVQDTAGAPVDALVYFSFKQTEAKQQQGTDMLLEIVSALPVTVKYDAVMFVATPSGIQPDRTSSCPVFAGAASIERWTVPLTMLALSNFRIAPERNPSCR
jgi:hypothetical protein